MPASNENLTALTALWMSASKDNQIATLDRFRAFFAEGNPWQRDAAGLHAVDVLWGILNNYSTANNSRASWKTLMKDALQHPDAPKDLHTQDIVVSRSIAKQWQTKPWPIALAASSANDLLQCYLSLGHKVAVKDGEGYTPLAHIPFRTEASHEEDDRIEFLRTLMKQAAAEDFNMLDCDYQKLWGVMAPSQLADLQRTLADIAIHARPASGFMGTPESTLRDLSQLLKRGPGVTAVRTSTVAAATRALLEKDPDFAAKIANLSMLGILANRGLSSQDIRKRAGYEWLLRQVMLAPPSTQLDSAMADVGFIFAAATRLQQTGGGGCFTPGIEGAERAFAHRQLLIDKYANNAFVGTPTEADMRRLHALFPDASEDSAHYLYEKLWIPFDDWGALSVLSDDVKKILFTATRSGDHALSLWLKGHSKPSQTDLLDFLTVFVAHASAAAAENFAEVVDESWRTSLYIRPYAPDIFYAAISRKDVPPGKVPEFRQTEVALEMERLQAAVSQPPNQKDVAAIEALHAAAAARRRQLPEHENAWKLFGVIEDLASTWVIAIAATDSSPPTAEKGPRI